MTALYLDRMTWAEVKEEIQKGRDTVVVPFGSTEQHGRHMPLGTDAVLGDEIGWGLAGRLGAFLAPTVRFGCSEHHLAFTGTISLGEKTFRSIVTDVVASLSVHGFRRIVLLPTHGGNFKPLAETVARIEPVKGVRILSFTDLEGLVNAAFESSRSFGVDAAKSGAHSGEWETSLMLALRPEQVKMDGSITCFSRVVYHETKFTKFFLRINRLIFSLGVSHYFIKSSIVFSTAQL
jgi:creatinine amidohydrolase